MIDEQTQLVPINSIEVPDQVERFLTRYLVPELKDMCRRVQGLPVTGAKGDLIRKVPRSSCLMICRVA
jgi:hypothetical protein